MCKQLKQAETSSVIEGFEIYVARFLQGNPLKSPCFQEIFGSLELVLFKKHG